jgi:hypothetical protein
MRRLVAALALVLVLVLGMQPNRAVAQPAPTQTISGVFSVIEGDPIGGIGQHKRDLYLVDENDRSRWTAATMSEAQIQRRVRLAPLSSAR